MPYTGSERRKNPRINTTFIISYRVVQEVKLPDVSQTKNISSSGLFFSTKRPFEAGTILELQLRLPFVFQVVRLMGKVIDSKEAIKDVLYETRVCFIDVPAATTKVLEITVDEALARDKKTKG